MTIPIIDMEATGQSVQQTHGQLPDSVSSPQRLSAS